MPDESMNAYGFVPAASNPAAHGVDVPELRNTGTASLHGVPYIDWRGVDLPKSTPAPTKRGPGRPRKNPVVSTETTGDE